MITALILAPNLILKEEQCQREHSRRRDTDIHTTELAGHLITPSAFNEDNPLPTLHASPIYSAMNSSVTRWFSSMPPVPPESFHFPGPSCNKELIHPTLWIRPSSVFSSCSGQASIPAWEAGLGPILHSLCPHPGARCQHSPQRSAYTTQPRWEGFSLLPSSRIVKRFLLDQKRSKLVNHTSGTARQLPRTSVCALPANRRCSLLLQAELSIIPDINHQAWTDRSLQLSAVVSGAEKPQ